MDSKKQKLQVISKVGFFLHCFYFGHPKSMCLKLVYYLPNWNKVVPDAREWCLVLTANTCSWSSDKAMKLLRPNIGWTWPIKIQAFFKKRLSLHFFPTIILNPMQQKFNPKYFIYPHQNRFSLKLTVITLIY